MKAIPKLISTTLAMEILLVANIALAGEREMPPILRAQKEIVNWPGEVEQIARELYSNKVEAMARDDMRIAMEDKATGERGLVGKIFIQNMAALADITDQNLLEKARSLEGTDLVAKFIVLAHDRKSRPEAYEAIRANYVDADFLDPKNRPAHGSVLESMVIESPPVRPEHATPAWQLPLEYGFFAPPIGVPARDDNARWYLYDAIVGLNMGEKTNILMLADAASVDPHIQSPEIKGSQLQGLRYLTNHPNSVNSTYLESLLAGQKAQHYGKRILETTFWIIPEDPEQALANRVAVWRKWLKYFDENPAERDKAKRLAELFEQAVAEAEKGKQ